MPYQTFRLTGGANTNETPALNQAGVSSSQLIRFKPDPAGMILPEKLGGWAKFYANQITSVVRAIFGWEDTDATRWFSYGTSNTTASSLVAVKCFANASGIVTASTTASNIFDITPSYISDAVPLNFTTTAGSSTVTIKDPQATLNGNINTVYLTTPVSVGGLILSGQYQISNLNSSNSTYTITATDTLGNPLAATYSTIASPVVVTGGSVSIVADRYFVTLTFAALGSAPFVVGDGVSFTGLSPITWNGTGIVQSCTTTSVTIASYEAVTGSYSSGGVITNYGLTPRIVPNPNTYILGVSFANHGYQVGDTFSFPNTVNVSGLSLFGNYTITRILAIDAFQVSVTTQPVGLYNCYLGSFAVTAGTSTTSAVTLTCGNAALASPTVTITGGSSTTSAVTLTWAVGTFANYAVGTSIYVSGIVSPSSWNGTFVVTASTANSVTYALSGSALSWGSGGTIGFPLFNIGDYISAQSLSPTAWNGVFQVTNSTPTTVTYALSGSATSLVSAGMVSTLGGKGILVYNSGLGAYSSGVTYGTNATSVFGTNWSIDNWGQILVASPISFSPTTPYGVQGLTYGPIYQWDPTSGTSKANPIVNGPLASTGFFVAMPQRQIIAWGTTFDGVIDPLLIRWCDVSNFNVWIGQTTNQAGSYRLSTGSAIIGALQAQQQALVWTDIGLWSMQYIGPPYVYSFNQLSVGCGLIARRAAGLMNGVAYWMGRSQFFMLSADGVVPIVCPIWDVVFQDLDLANLSKITIAVNSLFGEVTWYYPVLGGNGENSAYVRFNAITNTWDFGTLSRTAWMDNSVLGPPIGYDPVNSYVYQHEISPDADGQAMNASFTTGYFAIAESDEKAFIDQVRPDFKWGYYNQTQNASIQITFNAVDYAGQTPTTYGPYTVTSSTTYFSPRIRARLISVTVASSDTGSFWRLGALRYRVAPDGKF